MSRVAGKTSSPSVGKGVVPLRGQLVAVPCEEIHACFLIVGAQVRVLVSDDSRSNARHVEELDDLKVEPFHIDLHDVCSVELVLAQKRVERPARHKTGLQEFLDVRELRPVSQDHVAVE
jgi:hypothetical protein